MYAVGYTAVALFDSAKSFVTIAAFLRAFWAFPRLHGLRQVQARVGQRRAAAKRTQAATAAAATAASSETAATVAAARV